MKDKRVWGRVWGRGRQPAGPAGLALGTARRRLLPIPVAPGAPQPSAAGSAGNPSRSPRTRGNRRRRPNTPRSWAAGRSAPRNTAPADPSSTGAAASSRIPAGCSPEPSSVRRYTRFRFTDRLGKGERWFSLFILFFSCFIFALKERALRNLGSIFYFVSVFFFFSPLLLFPAI